MRRQYFNVLDGIRGIAALLVALRHTGNFFGAVGFPESYLAVDIFFVLSGAVIANAYERRLTADLSAARFMWLRVVRLYPLYIVGVAVSVLGIMRGFIVNDTSQSLPVLTMWSVVMLPNMTAIAHALLHPAVSQNDLLFPLSHAAWTLMFELAVNFLYAIIVPKLTLRRLKTIMAVTLLGIAICLYADDHHTLNSGWLVSTAPAGFFRAGYSFFCGVFLYRWSKYKKWPVMHEGQAAGAALAILAIVTALLCASPAAAFRPWFDFAAVAVFFPALVVSAMHVEVGGWIGNTCKLLGMMSYPLYAIHQPVGDFIDGMMALEFGVDVARYAPAAGYGLLAALVIIAWGLGQTYDIAVRRWLLMPGGAKAGRISARISCGAGRPSSRDVS